MQERADRGPGAGMDDTAGQASSLLDGAGRSRVGKLTPGGGAAEGRCRGAATTADDGPRPREAQTWCGARVAATDVRDH